MQYLSTTVTYLLIATHYALILSSILQFSLEPCQLSLSWSINSTLLLYHHHHSLNLVAMQVQVAMNGARAFKSPSLSPVPQTSTDLAHSLTRTVYEITTAAAESQEDKFNLGDEAVSYAATQYYTTVEPRSSASSPTMQAVSPKDSGNLTPISFSSKDSVSSETSSQETSAGSMQQQNMCLPSVSSSGMVSEGGQGIGGMNAVKNWTYEDQFKQVSSWPGA